MRLPFDPPDSAALGGGVRVSKAGFRRNLFSFVYRGLSLIKSPCNGEIRTAAYGLKSPTLLFSAPQDRTRTIRKRTSGRSSHFKLKIGSSAAHDGFCLMLLGSPPDMVHSPPLRSTGLSSLCGRPPCRKSVPPCPHHPRCSGLRVQSTANAPMCAALCGAEQKVFDC